MFARLKECLKNWLVTHERLYWYIVVGLAVFAFGVITAIGCAKLEKANAAIEFDHFHDTYNDEIIAVRDETKPYYAYLCYQYYKEDGSLYPYSACILIENDEDVLNYVLTDNFIFKDVLYFYNTSNGLQKVGSGVGLLATRVWDIHYMEGNMTITEDVFPETFNFEDVRPLKEEVIEEGFDKLGFVPQINSGRHIGLGLWHYNYTPCIGSVNSSGETVIPNLRVSYRIKLPTVSLVQSWIDNGYTKNDFEKDDIVLWRNSGAGIRIEVMDFYSPIACDLGYFALNLKSDITNAWQFLYGDIDISALDMVYQFAFPDVVVTSAFYDEFGTSVYGPKLVQFASSFSSDAKEVYYYDEEYLYSGHCSSITQYLEAVNAKLEEEDNVEDWLKEETYKAALEENELLKKQVEELRKKLASVGSSDGGLWDTFDDIVESFKNASDSFVSIGHVIGNVFSFMPVEVTGMLIFVFTALLVLAVYWAVRGK